MLCSILANQKWLKGIPDGLGPGFAQKWGEGVRNRGCDLPNICKIFDFWNLCILSSDGLRNLLHLLRCLGAMRAHISKNTYCPKIWKLHRNEAIRLLRLVETDAWHCQAYLTDNDLVKLSRWSGFKLGKQGHNHNGDLAARGPHMMRSIFGRQFTTPLFWVRGDRDELIRLPTHVFL